MEVVDKLGCDVGVFCERLSSLSMRSRVVLPALSMPRNKIFALL